MSDEAASEEVAPRPVRLPAVRLPAVHLHGIARLRDGEPDVELRISADGFDVLKRSTGVLIGRLRWSDVRTVELPRPRRSLLPRTRRDPEVHIVTAAGRASFALPGLADEEVRRHLQPLLERVHGTGGAAGRG